MHRGIVIAFAALPFVMMRQMKRVDERQREIALRAIVFSFFATAVVTFGYGFLEEVGAPRQSAFWVWGLMGAFWVIGGQIERYRDR